jgi:hypothetical protein
LPRKGGYKNRTLGINARNFFDGYLSTRIFKKTETLPAKGNSKKNN